MNPNDAITERQMLGVFVAATAAVIAAVVVGFLVFLSWGRRDRAKRNAQIRKVTGRNLDD